MTNCSKENLGSKNQRSGSVLKLFFLNFRLIFLKKSNLVFKIENRVCKLIIFYHINR